MTDGVEIDFSELDELAADLSDLSGETAENARKAVEVSARNIKDDWREQASGLAHAPAFPYSIDYDVERKTGVLTDEIRGEIGPDKNKTQGALGNLIEFGSVNNPPQGLGHGALQREEEGFQRGLEIAVEQGERKHRL